MSGVIAPGTLVHVRHRRWVVEDYTPPPVARQSSLVRLACVDDDAQGQELTVLWDCEPDARVLNDDEWGRLGAKGFDPPKVFAAYLNTRRWNSVTSTDPTLFQSPFRAGIRIEAYQLEPLRKALALPRVNLFIADDVGLGKTIEAGLIARELLLRRRIDNILVAAPPSMLTQWQEELESRFGLSFVIVDRAYYARSRRERGYGVNPWTTHSRFLISTRLLIEETYIAGLRDWLGEFQPRTLFILDEAHHAAPSGDGKYAIDSQITHYVRDIASRFEHRLFLSATPHNGHSNSFSALLEILDPDRFCRGVEVRPRDLDKIMVRRLKEDIRTLEGGFPRREVPVEEIHGLPADAPELIMAAKLDEYRKMREARLAKEPPSVQRKARLVLVTLQQRLLSSVEAFARTVGVHRRAMERAAAAAPSASGESARELATALAPIDADEERANADDAAVEQQMDFALETATADSVTEQDRKSGITAELELLSELQQLAEQHRDTDDARVRRLIEWVEKNLLDGSRWNKRRVIIFTEWEDTRRYLERRLRTALAHTERAEERIASFTGSTSPKKRDDLKHDFNSDPDDNPIRILIATDAAREGLNLQRQCHDLFHFDLPWNPSRIEQRNGRIDRKLQREPVVYCRYFFYRQRPEDRVLRALVRKTEKIRQELGSLSRIIDPKTISRLEAVGIRRDEIERDEAEIEKMDDAERVRIARKEIEEAEEIEKRTTRIRRDIDELRTFLKRSAARASVSPELMRQAVDTGLELSGSKALALVEPESSAHPPLYALPVEHGGLAQDASWLPALDMLRERRKADEKIPQWRRTAKLRPIAFEDTRDVGEGAVQVHVEHRLVRRVLGRFVSKGLLEYDLSRACLAVGPDAIPRVVLIGRLSLFGPGGARLHDELVEVTARWIDPADRKGALQPYAREAEERTLELLDRALEKPGRSVSDVVLNRLAASVNRDVSDLLPHLDQRLKDAQAKAEAELAKRAQRESEQMRELLDIQSRRIADKEKHWDQLQLDFSESEARQRERDRKHMLRRLDELAEKRRSEPQRILQNYAVKASRFEPVGIAYLWPGTG